mmetsp:Transcript_16601/g.41589  ORF Transcript_16601/g.41589 Transcript_16601/m.41589 type:complete len:239 (+) Transcript_16601:183-899(+)
MRLRHNHSQPITIDSIRSPPSSLPHLLGGILRRQQGDIVALGLLPSQFCYGIHWLLFRSRPCPVKDLVGRNRGCRIRSFERFVAGWFRKRCTRRGLRKRFRQIGLCRSCPDGSVQARRKRRGTSRGTDKTKGHGDCGRLGWKRTRSGGGPGQIATGGRGFVLSRKRRNRVGGKPKNQKQGCQPEQRQCDCPHQGGWRQNGRGGPRSPAGRWIGRPDERRMSRRLVFWTLQSRSRAGGQ